MFLGFLILSLFFLLYRIEALTIRVYLCEGCTGCTTSALRGSRSLSLRGVAGTGGFAGWEERFDGTDLPLGFSEFACCLCCYRQCDTIPFRHKGSATTTVVFFFFKLKKGYENCKLLKYPWFVSYREHYKRQGLLERGNKIIGLESFAGRRVSWGVLDRRF